MIIIKTSYIGEIADWRLKLSKIKENNRMSRVQDGGVERCALILSCENSKITTCCWKTIDKRMLEHTKKDTPCSRAKEKPQQDGRRDEIAFRIKPHTSHRYLVGSNKPCAHQDLETPQRLNENCIWVSPAEVCVSNGLLQGQGLWVQQTQVWDISSTIEPPEFMQDWGNGLLKSTKKLVCTMTQEKGAVIPQETDLDLTVSVQESPRGGVGQR